MHLRIAADPKYSVSVMCIRGCRVVASGTLLLTALTAGLTCTTPPQGDSNTNGNNNVNVNENSTGGDILMTFAVIGDYGDDDDNTRAVAEQIKSWMPDFILTVGDNDYSDGAYRGTFDGLELAVGQYFHEFIGNYQGSEGPGAAENRFFPVPGDHDWGDTCDEPEGLDDYLRYFTLPADNSGNERYYDFRRGPVHFFALHSLDGCEPNGVTADSAQAQWVRTAALASDATFKIAYFHNPPYSSGARHVGGGTHMRWPWDEWGFDLVMSGDDHVYERIEREDVVYLVNGLGGVDRHEFLAPPAAGSLFRFADEHGAVRADVYASHLDIRFLTAAGREVDRFEITARNDVDTDGGPLDPDAPPVTTGQWYRPDVSTTWQWQLQPDAGGEINTSYDVDVYDVDLFDVSDAVIADLQAAGRRVICYFSAGSYEPFRTDAAEFDPAELGLALAGFADERWLDIRAANVHRIMRERLDRAVARGCDGVEPDNVDGYANASGFPLTARDQLAFNRFLANEAHARGLSVALKNDLDQILELVDYFDFSVNEQCHEFEECSLLEPFIAAGKPVFNAEYLSEFVDDAGRRAALCADAQASNLRTLVLPLDLNDDFRISCDP